MFSQEDSSYSIDKSSNEYCKYDVKCKKIATNYCQECEQIHCVDHYLEHMLHIQDLLTQKLNSLLSQLSPNSILDLIEQNYQLKNESNETKRTINMLQQQWQILINEDEQNLHDQLTTTTYELESDYPSSLENDIERLRKDIEDLELILTEINMHEMDNSEETMTQQTDNPTISSHLPSEQMIGINDSNTSSKIKQKIHLSNNAVQWLRGPIKIMVNGAMHVLDMFAQTTHISDTVIQVVRQGYEKQQTNNNSFKPVFAQITADWIFESENIDQGLTSPSIWMRDSQNRRILVKTQDHPLCAANEWLAYILGKRLDLPVNEVQISIYQNNLVTLHTDIAHENEKTITFMNLSRQIRKRLLTNITIGCMSLFDHIIQNADRNPGNILITIPNTIDTIDYNTTKMNIYLIDHASCFGMGKLSIISLIACKFHTNHLSIIKFDPINEARKFEQYLNRLPISDRKLIGGTLNRFAEITNDQFDSWLIEIKDLLSPTQYNRIRDVLYRKRDIAKHYIIQWDICHIQSNNLQDE